MPHPSFFSETFSKFATVNLYKKYFFGHPVGGSGSSSEGRPEEKKGATAGPPPHLAAPRPDIDKYLLDPAFQYVDFAQRDKQNAFPTFRIQVPGDTSVTFAVADPDPRHFPDPRSKLMGPDPTYDVRYINYTLIKILLDKRRPLIKENASTCTTGTGTVCTM
jgi:hypothetical protein